MPTFIELNGQALHYEFRAGDTGRQAVVFANSLGTDFRIWDAVIALLPKGTPTLRFDKRGHGMSPLGETSIPSLANDLAALMDHVNITNAVACGVSVGGLIVQALASARQDLVSALILSNTGLKIGDDTVWDPRIDAARKAGLGPMADAVMERWFSTNFQKSRPTDLACYRAMLTGINPEGYARVCEAIRDCDLTQTTSTLTVPTTCIAGSADLATPPALVQMLAGAISNAHYVEIKGVGHLPCIEAPRDVAAIVTQHLSI